MTATPLLDGDFDALMARLGPFERHPVLAVAVSGGPDSMALTFLAADWAEKRGGRVIGLTVDHSLRPTSSDEARQTRRWLEAEGIEHHTLVWTGPKPSSAIPKHARAARYQRLHDWCRQAGILHLLVAHHRQDQAETVALRELRQSGPKGLAGMAAIRDLEGLRLLRPLLGVDSKRLRATLLHRGQDWIDDPSNRNLCFTRNRLRHDGINTASLIKEASVRGSERHRSDQKLSLALIQAVTIDPAGFAEVPISSFDKAPTDLAEDLLERVLMTIGNTIYPPRKAALRRLLEAMRDQRPFCARTLGHCRVLRQKERWLFCRETTGASTLTLPPGQWLHWQARLAIRYRGAAAGLAVRELGDQGWQERKNLMENDKIRDIPPAARSSLASIWCGRALLAIPHAGVFAPSFAPSLLDLQFRPRIPLANAPFAAHMCA